jgi:hypothetical protein
MENEPEFASSALAMTFVVRALSNILVEKGILSPDECLELFDQVQISLEQQQNCDVPANAEVWRAGRSFLDHLAGRLTPSGTVGVEDKQVKD